MSHLTPEQIRTRNRIEGLIQAASPLLDALLWAGDRVARVVEPDDFEPYPVRSVGGDRRTPIGGTTPPLYDRRARIG